MRAEHLRALLVLLAAALLALATPARAVERNFADSAQLDYFFVPTQSSVAYVPLPSAASAYGAPANAYSGTAAGGTANTLYGFTVEASMKLAVDITDHVSANLKVCYGCHGFEADMAYFDLRAADELNFRVGRFSPSFGAFNLRHDPANQKLSDKPLPYDMGRMLRYYLWNGGVLPSPFPDNGVEIDGTHWFGSVAQLDYAVYGVAGFRNHTQVGYLPDINFLDSRFPNYYVDNNLSPTGGGRLALTVKPGTLSDISLGVSGMGGAYDDAGKLFYAIFGGDLAFRINRTNLRMEYLVRRTDMGNDPAEFKYAMVGSSNFMVKHGGYVELEQPLVRDLDLILRTDGLYRVGNVAVWNPELAKNSGVLRETLGFAYALERNLRIKASVEGYEWTDKDASGHMLDVGGHVGLVGTF